MLTNTKRILKFGWQGFTRNKGLSFAVLFIMTISVFVVTSLLVFNELSSFLIKEIEKKVDVAVYFKKDIPESDILKVKEELYNFQGEIESVEYVSKEKALETFKQKHKNDPVYLKALEEVGDNPFLPSLNIKAKNPQLYAKISSFLTEGEFGSMIEKVSYYENEKVIQRLFSLTSGVKKGGIILSVILGILVILITFNTVKLTIVALKEEISTMKLVGASSGLIKGPFLVQGILYGVISVLICDILFFALIFFLNDSAVGWFLGFDLLSYLKENTFMIILSQVVFASMLGVFSTLFAVRKYLKDTE